MRAFSRSVLPPPDPPPLDSPPPHDLPLPLPLRLFLLPPPPPPPPPPFRASSTARLGAVGSGRRVTSHPCVAQSRTTGADRTSSANRVDKITAASPSSRSIHRSVSSRIHRARPSAAGAPPPSSPTATPRLHARRHSASTMPRLHASDSTLNTPPGIKTDAIVAPSPPAPHRSLCRRVPSLCVATTRALRASATAVDADRSRRVRS